MSFWILPGLDACPVGGDDPAHTTLDLFGSPEAVAQAAATDGADFSARGLLSPPAGGLLSPPPPAAAGNAPGLASGGGGGYGFEGEDESCFEGSNVVGSVRTILQVRLRCRFLG